MWTLPGDLLRTPTAGTQTIRLLEAAVRRTLESTRVGTLSPCADPIPLMSPSQLIHMLRASAIPQGPAEKRIFCTNRYALLHKLCTTCQCPRRSEMVSPAMFGGALQWVAAISWLSCGCTPALLPLEPFVCARSAPRYLSHAHATGPCVGLWPHCAPTTSMRFARCCPELVHNKRRPSESNAASESQAIKLKLKP